MRRFRNETNEYSCIHLMFFVIGQPLLYFLSYFNKDTRAVTTFDAKNSQNTQTIENKNSKNRKCKINILPNVPATQFPNSDANTHIISINDHPHLPPKGILEIQHFSLSWQ
eukprot:g451.t1